MLANAASLMDRNLSKPGESVLGADPCDWVLCQVVRREAEAMIGPRAAATQPTTQTAVK